MILQCSRAVSGPARHARSWLTFKDLPASAAIPLGTAEAQCKALLQGTQHTEQYEAKHESSLLYEGGTLSYDPTVYGGNFHDRYHIKTLQVRLSCTPCRRHGGVMVLCTLPVESQRHIHVSQMTLWLRVSALSSETHAASMVP